MKKKLLVLSPATQRALVRLLRRGHLPKTAIHQVTFWGLERRRLIVVSYDLKKGQYFAQLTPRGKAFALALATR